MRIDKTSEICNSLRQQIISGMFPLGSRLPAQTELIKKFSASNVTIQNAMKILGRQGFVNALGPRGTFVSEKPPFLKRIALLSPKDEEREDSFFHCFIARGKEIAKELGYELEVFYNYEGWRGFADYQRLVEEMESGLLAGLIFASNPFPLRQTPLLEYHGIPRIAFMQDKSYSNFDSVWIDYKQMVNKALDYFCELGCKRFGMICPQVAQEDLLGISNFEGRNIEFSSHLIQAVALDHAEWAENVVRLMMALPKKDRPDCLLIADDNLVWHTTKVLKDLKIKVPSDIAVVGHANFPCPSESIFTIRRIGFNIDDCFRLCINTIIARRKGERAKKRHVLPALFESEIT